RKMRIQRLGRADRLAGLGIDVLYGDIAVGPVGRAAAIAELGIGVADQVHAVAGGDDYAAVGLLGGADVHHLGEFGERGVALILQGRGLAARGVRVADLLVEIVDLLDQLVGGADRVDGLLVDLGAQRGDGAGDV